jgi:hypothetical protein
MSSRMAIASAGAISFRRTRIALVTIVVLMSVLITASAAAAATFTVTSDADLGDTNTADGVCQSSNGECTLRAAVDQANALAGDHLIELPAGTYDLSGATNEDANAGGDLDIFADNEDEDPMALTIRGAGARNTIVRSTVADRVFHVVDSDVTVTISGLTVTGGSGVTQGGGIFGNGPLAVSDVAVTGNTADSQGGTFGGQGGGIFSNAPLTLAGATLSGNHALATGADFPGQGGGLFVNDEPTTLTNVTVSGNDTDRGTFFPGQGGGIFLNDVSTLTGVTVSHNQADPSGFGQGGGIFYNDQLTARGVVVSDNLVGATPSECFENDVLISEGGNLERGTDCGFMHPSDQQGVDPLLGPLQDNGGPTDTRALAAGSPAIDAWPPEAGCPATDQRGVTRPQGPGCDSGAFEVEVADSATPGAAPGLIFDVTGRKKQKPVGPQVKPSKGRAKNPNRKVLSVKVTCQNQSCEALIGGKVKAAGEKLKFKAQSVSLQAGETKKLRLTGSKRQLAEVKAALKEGAKGKAKIKGTATSPAGETASDSFKIKLRGK